jgi:hypothetical protein
VRPTDKSPSRRPTRRRAEGPKDRQALPSPAERTCSTEKRTRAPPRSIARSPAGLRMIAGSIWTPRHALRSPPPRAALPTSLARTTGSTGERPTTIAAKGPSPSTRAWRLGLPNPPPEVQGPRARALPTMGASSSVRAKNSSPRARVSSIDEPSKGFSCRLLGRGRREGPAPLPNVAPLETGCYHHTGGSVVAEGSSSGPSRRGGK